MDISLVRITINLCHLCWKKKNQIAISLHIGSNSPPSSVNQIYCLLKTLLRLTKSKAKRIKANEEHQWTIRIVSFSHLWIERDRGRRGKRWSGALIRGGWWAAPTALALIGADPSSANILHGRSSFFYFTFFPLDIWSALSAESAYIYVHKKRWLCTSGDRRKVSPVKETQMKLARRSICVRLWK